MHARTRQQSSARTAFRPSRPQRLICSRRRAYIPATVTYKKFPDISYFNLLLLYISIQSPHNIGNTATKSRLMLLQNQRLIKDLQHAPHKNTDITAPLIIVLHLPETLEHNEPRHRRSIKYSCAPRSSAEDLRTRSCPIHESILLILCSKVSATTPRTATI